MARYDLSGIGINVRELPDENGVVKLKVLGLVLDGPAYSSGVRQVSLRRCTNRYMLQSKFAFVLSYLTFY